MYKMHKGKIDFDSKALPISIHGLGSPFFVGDVLYLLLAVPTILLRSVGFTGLFFSALVFFRLDENKAVKASCITVAKNISEFLQRGNGTYTFSPFLLPYLSFELALNSFIYRYPDARLSAIVLPPTASNWGKPFTSCTGSVFARNPPQPCGVLYYCRALFAIFLWSVR